MADAAKEAVKSAQAAAAEAAEKEPWLNANPTEHYKYYPKSLRTKNWLLAGSLMCFVGAVYAYTIHAVGSTDELQKAVEAYEKKQREMQLEQEPQQVAKAP